MFVLAGAGVYAVRRFGRVPSWATIGGAVVFLLVTKPLQDFAILFRSLNSFLVVGANKALIPI
jgi:hypothetical protein